MTDREKVVKGLECCTFILGKRKCNECPYQPDNGCYQLQDDFHVLLKEQEAVEPKIEKAMLDFQSWHYICGDCGGQIDIHDNYCRHCGRVVAHLSNRI